MTRTFTIAAGVLAAGYTVKHPELALLLFPIALLAIGWAVGSALLGGWQLLRYGGRRAKHQAGAPSCECNCSACSWRRRFEQPPAPWWGPR